jgi:hypothetical protein
VTTAFACAVNPEHVALEIVPIVELAEELAGVSSALLDAARTLLAS